MTGQNGSLRLCLGYSRWHSMGLYFCTIERGVHIRVIILKCIFISVEQNDDDLHSNRQVWNKLEDKGTAKLITQISR